MTFKIVERVGSTNQVLMEASLDEFPVGSSLMARTQTAGRGRAGRQWESAEGGLYLSTLLHPTNFDGLCLLGALAVVRVASSYGVTSSLRWPNDVYVDGQKLAGVLPQAKFRGQQLERAVLGVGLNVCQPPIGFSAPLRPTSTTLCEQTGQKLAPEQVATRYLMELAELYDLLERQGCVALAKLAEECLEGMGGPAVPVVVCQGEELRRYPVVSGLGASGELLFEGGQSLHSLGPDERLRFRGPQS